VLNHAFFLKVLTQGHGGILGILHGFLEKRSEFLLSGNSLC